MFFENVYKLFSLFVIWKAYIKNNECLFMGFIKLGDNRSRWSGTTQFTTPGLSRKNSKKSVKCNVLCEKPIWIRIRFIYTFLIVDKETCYFICYINLKCEKITLFLDLFYRHSRFLGFGKRKRKYKEK